VGRLVPAVPGRLPQVRRRHSGPQLSDAVSLNRTYSFQAERPQGARTHHVCHRLVQARPRAPRKLNLAHATELGTTNFVHLAQLICCLSGYVLIGPGNFQLNDASGIICYNCAFPRRMPFLVGIRIYYCFYLFTFFARSKTKHPSYKIQATFKTFNFF
jgi:hypothetical protein